MATYFKQNDTAPAYVVQLRDTTGGGDVAVDLTLASSVKFLMRSSGGSVKVNQPATFYDRAAGTLVYAWGASDLDTVGEYEVEFEVTWTDGTIETFPNDSYNTIVVVDDIA